MKKIAFITIALGMWAVTNAQELKEYDRSSLTTLMVFHPEDEFCKDIAVVFDTIPVSDKYNDHFVGNNRYIDFNTFWGLKKSNETYAFRSQDKTQLEQNEQMQEFLYNNNMMLVSPYYWDVYKKAVCPLLGIEYNENVSMELINSTFNSLSEKKQNAIRKKIPARGLFKAKYGKTLNETELRANALAIERLLNENQYGKRMVAKWFNLKGDSVDNAVFDMQLVQERGNYNATELDVATAMMTERGVAALADAGEELIGNTYVIVNDMTYVTSEEEAQVAKIATSSVLAVLGGVAAAATGNKSLTNDFDDLSKAVGDFADSFTGFKVKTHSYLYRLQWTEEAAAKFYKEYWTSTPNPEKIKAFLADTSTFKMKYVAHEYEFDKKSTFKGTVNRNEYIRYICTRSIDKNIAALQKQYEDFKVKALITDVVEDEKGGKTYASKIGLKEGITANSSFQVVQRYIDPKTNRTKYKYVATLKPVANKIWDNRYMLASEENKSDISATYFKKVSGGEVLPGMLIIEGKYRKVEAQ